MSISKISEIGKILGFGVRLRQLRLKKGLSQLELAQRIGRANASSINKYEDGQIPELGILEALCHELGVTKRYLLTGDESELIMVNEPDVPYPRLSRGDRQLLKELEEALDTDDSVADLLRTQVRSLLKYRKS